jgi:hypothetical protein
VTLERIWIPSPNYSSRGGATVTTIIVHTAEGARTITELGNFFASSSSGVSSHVGIDDTPNTVGEYVHRDRKAWTAAAANPWSVQAELCAFAAWTPEEWAAHPTMLANTAAWIAEEAAHFGIPLTKLDAAGAQNPNVRGVCQHNDLGSMGGGHWDCGPGFPIDQVLAMAAAGGSTPTPEPEEDDMRLYLVVGDSGDGSWWITDLQQKRYCPSLQHAKDTDYWLTQPGLGGGKPLVANRDASKDVAGPISIRQTYIDAVPEIPER